MYFEYLNKDIISNIYMKMYFEYLNQDVFRIFK